METTAIMTQFRVEDPALKISRRYRVVCGKFFDIDEKETYWIEMYLPNIREWVRVYRYAHWGTLLDLMRSNEFEKIMLRVV